SSASVQVPQFKCLIQLDTQLRGDVSMVFRRVLSVMFLALFVSSVAGAQTLSLGGRVADPQGGVVVNATVTLTGAAAGRPRSARTAADGTFVFEGIAPGRQ